MPSVINFGNKSGGDRTITIYDNLTFNNTNPGTLPYTINSDVACGSSVSNNS